MKCPQCGFEVTTGATFCSRCGSRIFAPRPEVKREFNVIRIMPSWWHFSGEILIDVVVLILGVAALVHSPGANAAVGPGGTVKVGLILIAAALAIFGLIVAARRHINWSITSERLIERRGFVATRRREVELMDIRSVEVDRRLWQRIRGIGNVLVASAASAEFLIRLEDVPDPEGVAEVIRQARSKRLI